MDKLLLRGYVTPADCGGDLQAALDLAEQLDIRKVVLEEDFTCEKLLIIPACTHLVLKKTLTADIHSKKLSNYNSEQDRIYIEGGKIVGNLYFYNSRRVILINTEIDGNVTYEFSRDMRMEYCTVSGSVQVGRGCAKSIFQDLTVGSFQISNSVFSGDIVPGKEPEIKNIVLRRSRLTNGSVELQAEESCGMFNIQADEITAPETAVIVGRAGETLPKELYFNLTFEALQAPQKLLCHNETKHMYTNL